MDIDKLQRINNLARELMKHGMAGSMDEAVRMAEEKINGSPEVSNIRNTMAGDVLSQSQVSHSSTGPAPKVTEDLDVRKLRIAFEDQSKMVNAMAGKIDELITEFNRLQQEINRLKTIQVPPAGEKEAQTQFRPQADEKKAAGAHARSGNYKPEDVSIEKVFYYGNR